MSNLLRVELFKVVHGKVFWVLFNIVIMISLLIVVLFFLGEKGILEKLEELDGVDITVEVDQSQSELLSANGINLLFDQIQEDRKSTRLNSSHVAISYAVFCLKK